MLIICEKIRIITVHRPSMIYKFKLYRRYHGSPGVLHLQIVSSHYGGIVWNYPRSLLSKLKQISRSNVGDIVTTMFCYLVYWPCLTLNQTHFNKYTAMHSIPTLLAEPLSSAKKTTHNQPVICRPELFVSNSDNVTVAWVSCISCCNYNRNKQGRCWFWKTWSRVCICISINNHSLSLTQRPKPHLVKYTTLHTKCKATGGIS